MQLALAVVVSNKHNTTVHKCSRLFNAENIIYFYGMRFNRSQSDFLFFWPSYFYAICSYEIFAPIIGPA